MTTRNRTRRGFTLVELLVVIAIIGILVALLLPAIQAAREAARRNSCLSNMKNLATALQVHHDSLNAFPLASTAAFNVGGTVGQYYTAGATAFQGDGYSWVVQLLPYIEEVPAYNLLTESVAAAGGNPARLGKLQDPAFPAFARVAGSVIPVLNCPTFPGSPDGAAGNMAVSNYMALAATHYDTNFLNLATAAPAAGAVNHNCASRSYCGNGTLVFPGLVSGQITRKGKGIRDMQRDGSSKTLVLAESRERQHTGWYSGLATYVVGTWPGGGAPGVDNTQGSPTFGKWRLLPQSGRNAAGVAAINVGSDRNDEVDQFYLSGDRNPHSSDARRWGPSSAHAAVVIHGYGDAHAKGVNQNVDPSVYLHLITIAGGEVTPDLE